MRRPRGWQRFTLRNVVLCSSLALIVIFVLNTAFLFSASRKLEDVSLQEEYPSPPAPEPPTPAVSYIPLKRDRLQSRPISNFADPKCRFIFPYRSLWTATFDWRSSQAHWNNTPTSNTRPQRTYQLLDVADGPVVTVAIPFYNTPFILFNETVTSILAQSLQRFELLIINDGSNNTEALAGLQNFRNSADKRIRVIDHEANRGLPAARNTGFRAAKTQYLFQFDSDDLLERTALEKLLWLLISHPEFAFSNGFTVGFGANNFILNKGFTQPSLFLTQNPITTNHMFRWSAWNLTGGYEESITAGMEDWDFNLLAMTHKLWGWTIAEPVDWYRQRPNHLLSRWKNFESDRLRNFVGHLKHKYSALYARMTSLNTEDWTLPTAEELFEKPLSAAPFSNVLKKTKPHLLLIIPWMAVGGADLYNAYLTRSFVERGWDVTVASTVCGDHSQYPLFLSYTPDVFVLPRFLKLGSRPAFLSYLIESRQPDVIALTNSELGYELLPYLMHKHPKPLYIDIGHMEEEYWHNGGYPRYSVGVNSLLDHSFVISEHLKDWMVQRGALAEKISTVYIGVDTTKWQRSEEARKHVRQLFNISDNSTVLLFVGRLSAQKNPNVLLTILKRLKQYEQGFYAFVLGDGEQRLWLEKLIHVSNLTQAKVITGANEDTVFDFMSASDILLLPSKLEGIALVLYEAMSMGLVPVSGDVGGQKELITKECDCGVLINTPHWSVIGEDSEVTALGQRYVGAVIKLLQNVTRVREMGAKARRRVVEHFELAGHTNRIIDKLCEVDKQRTVRNFTVPSGFETELAARAVQAVRGRERWGKLCTYDFAVDRREGKNP